MTSFIGVAIFAIFCQLYVADGAITEAPVNSAQLAGTMFQLNCKVDTSAVQTHWQYTAYTPTGSAIPIRIVYQCEVHPAYTDMYLTELSDEGDCHLFVMSANRASAGTYTCQNGFDSASAVVVMLDSEPFCQAYPSEDLIDGDHIEVSCIVSYNGSIQLAPKMRWTVQDTGASIDNATGGTFPNQVNSRINVPIYIPNSRPYHCQTYFDGPAGQPIAYVYDWTLPPVMVQYTVHGVVAQVRVRYFEESVLICGAGGYPPPTYTWINLNTGVQTPGAVVSVNPNGISRYGCLATNTIRGETVTIQTIVVTNLTREVPDFCSNTPDGSVTDESSTPEPTTPPSTASTTTTIATTTTTTPEPIPACGRAMHVVPTPPDAPGVPSNWTGMCYISQSDTQFVNQPCRNLIVDLPPGYANDAALVNAGGAFGCAITTRNDFLHATEACVAQGSPDTILGGCPSCPRLFMCFRLPPLP